MHPRDQFAGERGVTAHETDVEQRGQGVEIVVGDRQRLLHRPHRLPEHEPGVPQRIPERTRRVGARRAAPPAGVEEHHVDIGSRRELAAGVRTERHDCPRRRAGDRTGGVEEGVVDHGGEGRAERSTP